MTLEQLCAVRETLLEMLAWVELLITRARPVQVQRDETLNDAAVYFPRVRGVSPQK